MSTFKDFTILSKLGQGSFGAVFKVRRAADQRVYVLKRIALDAMGAAERELAVQECWLMASLNSPYVVRYFDSFNDEGALGIVMELCDGGDLQQALKARGGAALPEADVWHTFLHILLGVAYLHSRRTLHRDLKTANVFLTGGSGAGSVKLGDLGVARVLGSETAFARTCVGTPYYLSPELCQNQPYNEKSDMWACGIILYELCTGKHPFDARNQASLILKIVAGSYAPVSAAHYSWELRSLVDALLSRDSRRRPTALEVLAQPEVAARAEAAGLELPQAARNVLQARIVQQRLSSDGAGAGSAAAGAAAAPSSASPSQDFPQEDTDGEALRMMERLLESCNAESLSASMCSSMPLSPPLEELPSSQQWSAAPPEQVRGSGLGSGSGSGSGSGGGSGGGGDLVSVANPGALQSFLGSLGLAPPPPPQQQQQQQPSSGAMGTRPATEAPTAPHVASKWLPAQRALDVATSSTLFKEGTQVAIRRRLSEKERGRGGGHVAEGPAAAGAVPLPPTRTSGRATRGHGKGGAPVSGRGQLLPQQQQQQQRAPSSSSSGSAQKAGRAGARRAPLPLSQEALASAAAAAAAREAKSALRAGAGGGSSATGAGRRGMPGAAQQQQQQQQQRTPPPSRGPASGRADSLEGEGAAELGVLGQLGRPSGLLGGAKPSAAALARLERQRALEAAEVAALPDVPAAPPSSQASMALKRAQGGKKGAAPAPHHVSVHLLQAVSAAAAPPIPGLAPAIDTGAYAYNLAEGEEAEEEGAGSISEDSIEAADAAAAAAADGSSKGADFSVHFEVGEEEIEEEEGSGAGHEEQLGAASVEAGAAEEDGVEEELEGEEEEEEEEEEGIPDFHLIGLPQPGLEGEEGARAAAPHSAELAGEEARLQEAIHALRERVEDIIPAELIPSVLQLLQGCGEEEGLGAPPPDLPAPAWIFLVRLQHLEGKLAEVQRELQGLGAS